MQIFHELTIFEHENKKINGKIVFGRNFPIEIPDILCELKVLKDNFPRNIDKCLEIFEFLYKRYYKTYVWNSYEVLYLRTSMQLACDFMDKKLGSDNQFMSLQGPTNVGKTFRLTAFLNWLYLMNPTQTAITLTSTTADTTRARIWKDYLARFKEVQKAYPDIYTQKDWKVTNSKQNMGLAYIHSDNSCVVKAKSLNATIDEAKVIDDMIGTHGVYSWIAVDESTSCSTAILLARNNLSKNIISQIQLSGNPNDPDNLLGHAAKPAGGGYEDHDYDANDTYTNNYGTHIYFSPLKSPADLDPDPVVRAKLVEAKYPTFAQVEAEKIQYGEDSDDFYRFTLGRIKLGEKDGGILSAKTIDKWDCLKNVEFAPGAIITKILGVDPSLGTANSDKSIAYILRVGLSVDGYVKVCLGGGQLNRVLHEMRYDRSNTATALYQMAEGVKKIATENSILPQHIGVDAKPLGGSEILRREFSNLIRVIDGGSSPSNRVIIKDKTAKDLYTNKIAECYIQFKLFVEAGLVGGIPECVLKYFYSRKIVKEETDRKTGIESKEDYLKRTKDNSPDIPDAIIYGFDVAIVMLNLVLESVRSQNVNSKMKDAMLRRKALEAQEREDKIKKQQIPFSVSQIRSTGFSKRRRSRY